MEKIKGGKEKAFSSFPFVFFFTLNFFASEPDLRLVACVGWCPIWCGVVSMFWCMGSNAILSTSKDNFNS